MVRPEAVRLDMNTIQAMQKRYPNISFHLPYAQLQATLSGQVMTAVSKSASSLPELGGAALFLA